MATKRINITFPNKESAYGTLSCVGGGSFQILGQKGRNYPKDLTVNVSDKSNPHFSSEFQCNLPYAIKLDGGKGVYLHEDVTSQNGDLSHQNTHGCINLKKGDAVKVYNWVDGRTRVVIDHKW